MAALSVASLPAIRGLRTRNPDRTDTRTPSACGAGAALESAPEPAPEICHIYGAIGLRRLPVYMRQISGRISDTPESGRVVPMLAAGATVPGLSNGSASNAGDEVELISSCRSAGYSTGVFVIGGIAHIHRGCMVSGK